MLALTVQAGDYITIGDDVVTHTPGLLQLVRL